MAKAPPGEMLPFIDLKAQYLRLKPEIDAGIERVLDHSRFMLGPEVSAFETALADHVGVAHVVSCANGTDALILALMAEKIGPGDAVFVPAFTVTATAEAVLLVGATPVFVDVNGEDFLIDGADLALKIDAVKADGRDSAWAQYTIQVADRDGLAEALREEGIPSAIHYPLPMRNCNPPIAHVAMAPGLSR